MPPKTISGTRELTLRGKREHDMDKFLEHYFEALGTREKDRLAKACALAHEIRKFEIELYWKRATYFWAFQLIAFAALGLLFRDGKVACLGLLLIPASLGVITAHAGYLTALGSKFWQENWEAHVDLLENEMGVRLTQIILCREHPQFSVSRINQFLLRLLRAGWALALLLGSGALVSSAIPQLPEVRKWLWALFGIGAVLVVVVVCWRMCASNRTDFAGRMYRLGESDDWKEHPSKRKRAAPFIIWRDPLSEERARGAGAERAATSPPIARSTE